MQKAAPIPVANSTPSAMPVRAPSVSSDEANKPPAAVAFVVCVGVDGDAVTLGVGDGEGINGEAMTLSVGDGVGVDEDG